MGAVNTNNVALSVAVETSLGVAPANAAAEYLEPNSIDTYGATITTVARNPISRDRQNKKGAIAELESSVSLAGDLTASFMLDFAEGVWFSQFKKRGAWFQSEISAVASDNGYTLSTPISSAVPEGAILFSRGWVNGANNGLKVVGAGGSTTAIPVEGSVVDETAPASASVYVVGVQGEAGQFSIDADGNLLSSAAVFDQYDIQVGSAIFIGGITAATSFDTVADGGLARVRAVVPTKLTLDKRQAVYVADAGTGKTIQVFFGWFIRNVPTDHPDFLERSYTFEAAYLGVGDNNEEGYEYSIGNMINTLELSLPLNEKSEMSIETFGLDTQEITNTKRAWTYKKPLFTEAYSTPNDFLRLRLQKYDEEGLSTFFKEATLTIGNNVSGEAVLGKLGPEFMSYGNFDVTLSASAVFTNQRIPAMIRNNCTVTVDMCLYNNDAGFYIDIPAMTLGDGTKDFAVNEKVKIALESDAFEDPELGYTVSMTFFPYLPSDRYGIC